VALGAGLLAALLLAPALARTDGRHALGFGLRAPASPTGVVACLVLLLLAGLTRPGTLRLGPTPLPRPTSVLALAAWVGTGLAGALTLLAALLRIAAHGQHLALTGDDLPATLAALRGTGRVLLIAALALAVGLVVGALVLLTRRTRDDLLSLRGRQAAGVGLAAGAVLGLLSTTHLTELAHVFPALDRDDPVVYLANEVFGATGALDGVQHWGLFAVAGYAVVTALLFGAVAVRAAVEAVPRRAGNFATGAGYGLCAALGAYLIVHGWYELGYWPRATESVPADAPAVLRAGHAVWAVGWPLLLGTVALLGLAGAARAAAGAGSAARTVRQFRDLR
jgi:hypothetical protein